MIENKKSTYCSNVCHAWCCRYIVCDFVPTIDDAQDDELFFSLRGIKRENGKIYIPIRCRWLTNHDKCKLYTFRPKSCRAYQCEDIKRIK